ncbi:hypothetical protein Tco_0016700 [Tanacetum coccineum]
MQQTCRGDALRKRPHDDHLDNQHEGEKVKCQRIMGESSSKPTGNTNVKEEQMQGSGDTKALKDDIEIGLKLISEVVVQILENKEAQTANRDATLVERTVEQQEPMFGVIYDNDKSKKGFMAHDEIMKFSTGILEWVRSRIRQKLIDNNFNIVNLKLIEEEVADLRKNGIYNT